MHDVIIIGGSYAGLAAALQLARARRDVLVIDAGQRRNRFVKSAHGFLSQDGQSPDAIAAAGRANVLAYPTVKLREGLVSELSGRENAFVARVGGETHEAKRLVIATGVSDELPALPGLEERWGKSVFHCPYCDGYELNRGRIAVLATGPTSAHQAMLATEWGDVTLFLNDAFEPDAEQLAGLAARRVVVERTAVLGVNGAISVALRDGRLLPFAGLFVMPRVVIKDRFAEQLGCELDAGPMGPHYKTDVTKETTVKGVFACGDVGQPMPAVAYAVADGTRAGASAHQSLVFRPDPIA